MIAVIEASRRWEAYQWNWICKLACGHYTIRAAQRWTYAARKMSELPSPKRVAGCLQCDSKTEEQRERVA
jgi:hypothetical protein